MSQSSDPSSLIPYISRLRALFGDSEPPEMDWAIANKNFYIANTRIDRRAKEKETRAALEAFAANPGNDAASHLYKLLLEHRLLSGMYSEQRIPELGDGLTLDAATIGKLREIVDTTPHRVVFINAMIWLFASGKDLDTELLCATAFESELTDAIWYIERTQEAVPIRCDSLTVALAKAGSYEARMWLCGQLDGKPTDELRGVALRYAFSDATPESAELYGEPNLEFAPALVKFVEQTKLIDALGAETIDDALCRAALRICAEGICTSLMDGVELSFFRQMISIDVLFSRFVGHLQRRSLSLDELSNLAWIYDCVFEEIEFWLSKDPDALIEEGDLVSGRKEHRVLAEKIRDVFTTAENKDLLKVMVKAGGVDAMVAKQALDRVRPNDDFLELLEDFQARLSRGADQRNVPIAGFRQMIEAVGGDASNIAKIIGWCEDYLAFAVASASNLPADAQYILRLALPLLRFRPGAGVGLIQAGLESRTHHHIALDVLQSWPVDRWPESAERLLRRGLTRSQRDAELFQQAIDKLVERNTEP